MRPPFLPMLIMVSLGCEAHGLGPVVSAPSERSCPAAGVVVPERSNRPAAPLACGKPWRLNVIGGDGQVVVVCANDVRRQALGEESPVARALSPALDPARERVCACAGRMRAPPFVDLVFTAKPEEGRVTIQATGDDDMDPDLGPSFVACIGSVVARFAPMSSEACSDARHGSFIYPVRLELEE